MRPMQVLYSVVCCGQNGIDAFDTECAKCDDTFRISESNIFGFANNVFSRTFYIFGFCVVFSVCVLAIASVLTASTRLLSGNAIHAGHETKIRSKNQIVLFA